MAGIVELLGDLIQRHLFAAADKRLAAGDEIDLGGDVPGAAILLALYPDLPILLQEPDVLDGQAVVFPADQAGVAVTVDASLAPFCLKRRHNTGKAVGDDMEIMTDANQAQSAAGWQPGVVWDFRRAVETARELEKLNVYWLEEPLRRYDFDSLAELNRLVEIPIAGGENNIGVHEYRTMLEKGVFDILQPDIMVADGVTGFREIASLASAYKKRVVPHHGGGNLGTIAQLHCIASWPHAPWIEILHDPPVAAYTNGFAMMENPPLVDKEGYMNLPQGPGLGVTINKDLIA